MSIPKHLNDTLSANVYIDYENICELLRMYEVNPFSINFFPVIMDKFKNEYKFNIIDCFAYANFGKKVFQGKHQTELCNLGIQTRHITSNGKNCSDMMLTVEAALALSKYPNIKAYVIISSDRDMVPLLTAIKADKKLTCLISTRFGFDSTVSKCADHHEYIEDIFGLTPEMMLINEEKIYQSSIWRAKEVSSWFYNSFVWQNYESTGHPVTLKGYSEIIAIKIKRHPSQIIKDFYLADALNFVALYKDSSCPNRGLCIKKGTNYKEVFEQGATG